MEAVNITINQNFFLFCCAEKYNIISAHHSLSWKSNYFLRYTYPDGTTADASAHPSGENVLTSQSPEHDHSCSVHARLYTITGEHVQTMAEFSLDLVSPVEYLFRKFSANEFEMSDKVSHKMISALLAMSLSYYFVMGEHVEKEMRRTDEILSTLLGWSSDESYTNVTEDRKATSTEEGITLFAQHYKLQKTLRHLSQDSSVGDLPVHLPKSLLVPVEKILPRRPAIVPRTRSLTLPGGTKASPIADPVAKRASSTSSSQEYSALQPVDLDPQEGYMYMEKPDKYDVGYDDTDHTLDNSDEEEYFLVDPPLNDSKGKQSSEDKISTKSKQPTGSKKTVDSRYMLSKQPISFSSPAKLPRVPVEDFIPDEVYELCDLTPAEMAAVEILKKRGPKPKPTVGPYRGSHTIERSHLINKMGGEYGVLRPGELNDQFKSSLESSLKCSMEWMSLKETEPKPPPVLGPKPPSLGPKPPSFGPKPRTLEPKPRTLESKPLTVEPRPRTLGPKPAVKVKPPIKSPKPVRELKPPPRKKHNILNKRTEQPT